MPTTGQRWRGISAVICPCVLSLPSVRNLLSYDCDGLTLDRHITAACGAARDHRADVSMCCAVAINGGFPLWPRQRNGAFRRCVGRCSSPDGGHESHASSARGRSANQRVTVQPGVINSWVTRAVAGDGFYYAPDPSSQVVCSIGGNVVRTPGGALPQIRRHQQPCPRAEWFSPTAPSRSWAMVWRRRPSLICAVPSSAVKAPWGWRRPSL